MAHYTTKRYKRGKLMHVMSRFSLSSHKQLLNALIKWLNVHLMLLHAEMLQAGERGGQVFFVSPFVT